MKPLVISIAAVAAIIVLAVGALAALNDGLPLGGEAEPEEIVFASERHVYSLTLPDDSWHVVQYPGTWLPGSAFNQDDRGVDRALQPDSPGDAYVLFNSQEAPDGMTLEEWVEFNGEANQRAFPGCLLFGSEPTELGGEPAVYTSIVCGSQNAAEVLALHNGRGYAFRVFGPALPSWDPRPVVEEWSPRFSFTD